jgi:hypothetical protein
MGDFMDKQQRTLRLMNKTGRMALFMTISVLILIVSVMGVAKLSLKISEAGREQGAAQAFTMEDKTGLNVLEADILLKMADAMELSRVTETGAGGTKYYAPYFEYLMQYYRNNDLKFNKEAVTRINGLINDMNELIHLEESSQISEMSLDGREVYIYILEQVYELSGLEVIINSDGDIEQVSDQTGSVIYQDKPEQQTIFQVNSLIIIVSAIVVMISICCAIARRNQLFEKDVEYHGVKEKRVA